MLSWFCIDAQGNVNGLTKGYTVAPRRSMEVQ